MKWIEMFSAHLTELRLYFVTSSLKEVRENEMKSGLKSDRLNLLRKINGRLLFLASNRLKNRLPEEVLDTGVPCIFIFMEFLRITDAGKTKLG